MSDTIKPVVTCKPITVYLTDKGTWTINTQDMKNMVLDYSDNCTKKEDLIFSANPKYFDCSNVGKNNTIQISVTDQCGNVGTCTNSQVTVLDTLKPVVKCKNITITLDAAGKAMIFPDNVNDGDDRESVPAWALTYNHLEGGSWDNCGISYVCLDDAQSSQIYNCSKLGVNTVILKMKDPSGNEGRCTATVTVVDNIPPVMAAVSNVSLIVPPGTCTTKVANYPAISATDVCSPAISLVSGLGPNGNFPLGTTTETYKAVDAGGNSATVSFTVTVTTYNGAPAINPVVDVTAAEDAGTVNVPLTGISYGPDCSAQNLTLTAVSGNTSLVTAVAVSYTAGSSTASLALTIAPNKSGEAIITLTLKDDGGTANGGTDTTVKTFKVTITPVNDPPYVVNRIPDQQVNAGRTITVNISSVIGTIFNDIDTGDALTVTATKQGGAALPSYITRAGDILTVKPLLTDTGCYNIVVKATDMAGAFATDTFKMCILKYVTGIEDLGGGVFEVKMYPNPTQGPVNLDVQSSPADMTVSVFNILGVETFRKEYRSAQRITFDLSGNSSGIYFVRLRSGENEVIKKLILDKK